MLVHSSESCGGFKNSEAISVFVLDNQPSSLKPIGIALAIHCILRSCSKATRMKSSLICHMVLAWCSALDLGLAPVAFLNRFASANKVNSGLLVDDVASV